MIINLELKFGKDRPSYNQPDLDKFIATSTAHLIRRKKPDLVMVHLVSVDAAKHKHGVESPVIAETVGILDNCIGEIIEACDDDYRFVLFSDHGQFTINYNVHINALLSQHGLVDYANKDYKAYVQPAGGCGILHAKNNENMDKALQIIKDNKELLGIEDIYKREDLDKLRVDNDIQYMIECKAGYNLVETDNDEIIVDLKKNNIAYATHGYNPNKDGYECLFIANGDGIAKGKSIGKINMVDIAPTVMRLMDIDMNDCDGQVIDEIFE